MQFKKRQSRSLSPRCPCPAERATETTVTQTLGRKIEEKTKGKFP